MATFQIDIRRNTKLKSGLYPIYIFFNSQSEQRKISLKKKVKLQDWKGDPMKGFVKSSDPLAQDLNFQLNRIWRESSELIDQANRYAWSLEKIIREYNKERASGSTLLEFGHTMVEEKIKLGKTGNAKVYHSALEQIKKFNNKDIALSELDYEFLNKFKNYKKESGVTNNTIANYLRSLRAIYNEAVKRGLTDDQRPFKSGLIEKSKPKKRGIDRETVRQLEELEGLTGNDEKAVKLFLLCFYLRGIDLIDLVHLKPESLKKGRIRYERYKLDDSPELNVKVEPEALDILQQYKGNDYLIDFLKRPKNDSMEAQTEYELNYCRFLYHLKKICTMHDIERVTFKAARHSWGTIARNEANVSYDLIREALGHASKNMTDFYLKEYPEHVLDEANRKVIDCVGGNFGL